MSLKGTAPQTRDAIQSLHAELQREPTWHELLDRLSPTRGEIFSQLASIAARYPDRTSRLLASDAAEVRRLAEAIENESRGVTATTARNLSVQIQSGALLTALQVGSLLELAHELFKGFVEKRVSILRKQCENDDSIDVYVPKKRYVLLPKSAGFRVILERDMMAFPALFDRQALLTALGYDATIYMDVAQHQIREALRTGRVPAVVNGCCKPVRELPSAPLRAEFRKISEASEMFSRIFRVYFDVQSGRDLVLMWYWTKPQGVRAANFLDGVRNFQIDNMNRLYDDLLSEPLPHVHGHPHFAADWVRARRLVPSCPLTTIAEIEAEFDALHAFGIDRLSRQNDGGGRAPHPRRWWPSRGPTMMRPLHYERRIALRKDALPERGGSIS